MTEPCIDPIDRRLIAWLQNEFPIEESPYQGVADELEITPDEVWQRIEELKQAGVIRRLGASLDSRKLGYSSTLAAVHVPDDQVERASAVIASHDEVTHSYLRNDPFNIWFTVIAVDEARIEAVLKGIRSQLGLAQEDLLNVPVERLFKLDARFFPKS